MALDFTNNVKTSKTEVSLDSLDTNELSELKRKHKKQEYRIIHYIKIGYMLLIAFLFAVCIVVYLWNLLLPPSIQWITDKELLSDLRGAPYSLG